MPGAEKVGVTICSSQAKPSEWRVSALSLSPTGSSQSRSLTSFAISVLPLCAQNAEGVQVFPLFYLIDFFSPFLTWYVDYVARSRSLSSWSEGERALGVVIPTRFPCISYSHRSILSSTRVSYSLIFALFFLFGRSGVNMASFYDELEEIAGYDEEPPYEEDQRDTEARFAAMLKGYSIMDHTSNSLAQKGFGCFDPSSRFRRPGMLPSLFGVPAIVVSPLGLPFASLLDYPYSVYAVRDNDVPVRPVLEPMKEKNPLAGKPPYKLLEWVADFLSTPSFDARLKASYSSPSAKTTSAA
ncbi:unnamed protein product [Sphenostylis stenocarpa]|uniref:Uncharacterized protein n=1 Tax=Sphenostylis stenocarpa TaxID=92480 RepID=A0AA86SG88_9FABA|nr:unnamed protein product [Sphenostylis stenocarpa]